MPDQLDGNFAVLEVLRHMSNEQRYPHFRDVAEALRKAKRLTLKQVGENLGVQKEPARRLQERCIAYPEAVQRFCSEGLKLPDSAVRQLLAELDRRRNKQGKELLHQVYSVTDDEFALIAKSVLDYYGKTVEDLPKSARLWEWNKQAIAQGGITPGQKITFAPFQRHDFLKAVGEMAQDLHYDEDQMLVDAKGSMIGKTMPLRPMEEMSSSLSKTVHDPQRTLMPHAPAQSTSSSQPVPDISGNRSYQIAKIAFNLVQLFAGPAVEFKVQAMFFENGKLIDQTTITKNPEKKR